MSVKDQQALDRLYAIDNVLTIEITMPQADWDAVRTEQPAGGTVQLRLDGRQPIHVAQGDLGRRYPEQVSPRPRRSPASESRRNPSADRSTARSPACTSTSANSAATVASAAEDLIGSRYLTLNNSIQDPSYVRQPLGYTLTRHGRAAALAMQFRSGAGQREADRPGRRRRQRPRRLRQHRTDHEALHRTELQRQPERQPVRARTPRRLHQREDPVHRRGITVQVRRQGRPETGRRPDRRARPGTARTR